MSVEYYFGLPANGWTSYNATTVQVRADATASTFMSTNATKLAMSADLTVKLAGAIVNLNSPAVLSIGIAGDVKAQWKQGEFHYVGDLAKIEATKASAGMQQTESVLTDFKSTVQRFSTISTYMENRATAVSSFITMFES